MLEVKNLEKHFGDFVAVKGVSFSVKAGEVLGFLGPNGAGKSTTMRMITGFLPPTSGTAVIDGHDITSDPIAAKRALGYLPESAPSYRAMTVRDYLAFVASVRHDACPDVKKAVDEVIVKAKLEKVAGQTIETLSKGYRQRTAFAAAIIHDPKVLIMDEPTAGLDPQERIRFRNLIAKIGQDRIVLLSTHIVTDLEHIADRLMIMRDGQLLWQGSRSEGGDDLEAFYLSRIGDPDLKARG